MFARNDDKARPAATSTRAPLAHERPQRLTERSDVDTGIARFRAAEQRVAQRGARLKGAEAAKGAIIDSLQQIEARGEDPAQSLAHAEAAVTAERRMLAVADEELARARADLDRVLAVARGAAVPEWERYLESMLAEQEEHLWKVLALNLAIGRAIGDLVTDGVPLAARGPHGFPGFPFLHTPEAIFTWIRNRAVAPRRALSPIPAFAKEEKRS